MLNQQEDECVTCKGCVQLQQELEQCKTEHTLKYTMLKQKIMLVDELIRQYQAKTQENSLLKNKLEELANRLSSSRKDCKVLEEQLSTTLKEIIPVRSEIGRIKLENKQLLENVEKLKDEQMANTAFCTQLQSLLSKKEEELQTATLELSHFSKSDLKNLEKVKEDTLVLKKRSSEQRQQNSSTVRKLRQCKIRLRQFRELLINHHLPIPKCKKSNEEEIQKSDSSDEEGLIGTEDLEELTIKKNSLSKKPSQNDERSQTIAEEEFIKYVDDSKETLEHQQKIRGSSTVEEDLTLPEADKGSRKDLVFKKWALLDMKGIPACLSPIPPSPCRYLVKKQSENSSSEEEVEDEMSLIADEIDTALEKCQDSPELVPPLDITKQTDSTTSSENIMQMNESCEQATLSLEINEQIKLPSRSTVKTKKHIENSSKYMQRSNPVRSSQRTRKRSNEIVKDTSQEALLLDSLKSSTLLEMDKECTQESSEFSLSDRLHPVRHPLGNMSKKLTNVSLQNMLSLPTPIPAESPANTTALFDQIELPQESSIRISTNLKSPRSTKINNQHDKDDLVLNKCKQDMPPLEILDPIKTPQTSKQLKESTPQRVTRSRTRNSSSSCKENDHVELPRRIRKKTCRSHNISTDHLELGLSSSKSLSDTSEDEHNEVTLNPFIELNKTLKSEEFKISEEKCTTNKVMECTNLPKINASEAVEQNKEHTMMETGLKELPNKIENCDSSAIGDKEETTHELNLSSKLQNKGTIGDESNACGLGKTNSLDIHTVREDKIKTFNLDRNKSLEINPDLLSNANCQLQNGFNGVVEINVNSEQNIDVSKIELCCEDQSEIHNGNEINSDDKNNNFATFSGTGFISTSARDIDTNTKQKGLTQSESLSSKIPVSKTNYSITNTLVVPMKMTIVNEDSHKDSKVVKANNIDKEIELGSINNEVTDFLSTLSDEGDDENEKSESSKAVEKVHIKAIDETLHIQMLQQEVTQVALDLENTEQKKDSDVIASDNKGSLVQCLKTSGEVLDLNILHSKSTKEQESDQSSNKNTIVYNLKNIASPSIDHVGNNSVFAQVISVEKNGHKLSDNINTEVDVSCLEKDNVLKKSEIRTLSLHGNNSSLENKCVTVAEVARKMQSIGNRKENPIINEKKIVEDEVKILKQPDGLIGSGTKPDHKLPKHTSSAITKSNKFQLNSYFVKASTKNEQSNAVNVKEQMTEVMVGNQSSNRTLSKDNLCTVKDGEQSKMSTGVCGDVKVDKIKETYSKPLPLTPKTKLMSDGNMVFKTNSDKKLKRQLPDTNRNGSQNKFQKTFHEFTKQPSRITRSAANNRSGEQGSTDHLGSNNIAHTSNVHSSNISCSPATTSKSLKNFPNKSKPFSETLTNILSSLEEKESVKDDVVLHQRLKKKGESRTACKSLQFGGEDELSSSFHNLDHISRRLRRTSGDCNQQKYITCAQKRSIQISTRPLVSPISVSPLTLPNQPPCVSPIISRGNTPTLHSSWNNLSLSPLPRPVSPLPPSPKKSTHRYSPGFHRLPISPLTVPSHGKRLAQENTLTLVTRLSPLLDSQTGANTSVQHTKKRRIAHQPAYSPSIPNMVSRWSEQSLTSSPVSPPRIHASVPEGAVTVKASRYTDGMSAFQCSTPENIGNPQNSGGASNPLLKHNCRQSSFNKPLDSVFKPRKNNMDLGRKSVMAMNKDQKNDCAEMKQVKCCPSVSEDRFSPEVQSQNLVFSKQGFDSHTGGATGQVTQQEDHHVCEQQNVQLPGEVNGNLWCRIEQSRINHGKKKRQTRKKKKLKQKKTPVEVQRLNYQLDSERAVGMDVEDCLEFLVSQISNVTNDATANRAASRLICFLVLNHVNLLPVLKAMCDSCNKSTKLLVTPHEEMLINAISANETINFTEIVLHHLKQTLFFLKEIKGIEDQVSIGMTLCRCYAALCRHKGLSYADNVRILLYDLINEKVDNVAHLVLSVTSIWSAVLQNTSSCVNLTIKTFVLHLLQRQIEQGQYTAIIIQNCFKSLYDWPVMMSQPLSKFCLDLVNELKTEQVAVVETNEGDSCLSSATYDLVKAVELVSSQLSWEWTKCQLIEQTLWPIVEHWRSHLKGVDESKEGTICAVLQIIGELSHQGLSCNVQSVKGMLTNIGNLLEQDYNRSVSWKTQIFIVKTLMRLSPSNPKLARELICCWLKQSDRIVPVAVRNALQALAGNA